MNPTINAETGELQDGTPAENPYSPEGVDLTLIHWMLSLTPAERLQVLQRHVRAVLKLRHDNPQL